MKYDKTNLPEDVKNYLEEIYNDEDLYGGLHGYGKPCDMALDFWSKGRGVGAGRST